MRFSERKVPLTVTGRAASSTDAATWSSYREAFASNAGAGLGFVLNGDGIVCVDLDGCLTAGGELTATAQRVLRLAGETYVEVSPSGRGLHVWGRAEVDRGRKLTVDGGPVELYPHGRYITVTGRAFGSSPSKLGDLGGLVADLLGSS